MTILATGIVAIVSFFPMSLRQNHLAIDKSIAAYLAQMKAEELRRDNNAGGALIDEIKEMRVETPRATFPIDKRFAYSFTGLSIPDPADPGNPASNHQVALIVVRYSRDYRATEDFLYRLAFE